VSNKYSTNRLTNVLGCFVVNFLDLRWKAWLNRIQRADCVGNIDVVIHY